MMSLARDPAYQLVETDNSKVPRYFFNAFAAESDMNRSPSNESDSPWCLLNALAMSVGK